MKRITIDYILSRKPCYSREQLEDMFKGRKFVYPITVIKEAKPEDAIWLLAHTDFIPEKKLHLLACDYAEHIELTEESKKLVKAKRDWVAGKITDDELDELRAAYRAAYSAADWAAYRAAYWAADWAAYRAAYMAAERAAYMAAYSAAYRSSYWAADLSVERKWQLEQVRRVMEVMA